MQQNPPRQPAPPQHSPRESGRSERMGEHLRHIYDDVLHEPVPDQFAELLKKLG